MLTNIQRGISTLILDLEALSTIVRDHRHRELRATSPKYLLKVLAGMCIKFHRAKLSEGFARVLRVKWLRLDPDGAADVVG